MKSRLPQASSSTDDHDLPSAMPMAHSAIPMAGPGPSSLARGEMDTDMDADEETVGESEIEMPKKIWRKTSSAKRGT